MLLTAVDAVFRYEDLLSESYRVESQYLALAWLTHRLHGKNDIRSRGVSTPDRLRTVVPRPMG